jgi:hypothetical protein
MNNQQIPTQALIDCGAMGLAFTDQDLACHYRIPLSEHKEKTLV